MCCVSLRPMNSVHDVNVDKQLFVVVFVVVVCDGGGCGVVVGVGVGGVVIIQSSCDENVHVYFDVDVVVDG